MTHFPLSPRGARRQGGHSSAAGQNIRVGAKSLPAPARAPRSQSTTKASKLYPPPRHTSHLPPTPAAHYAPIFVESCHQHCPPSLKRTPLLPARTSMHCYPNPPPCKCSQSHQTCLLGSWRRPHSWPNCRAWSKRLNAQGASGFIATSISEFVSDLPNVHTESHGRDCRRCASATLQGVHQNRR